MRHGIGVILLASVLAAQYSPPSGGGSGTVTSIATTGPVTGGTITGTGTIACATCGVTGSPLSQFAATTSAQLAGVLSDETGTGTAVFGSTPTISNINLTGQGTIAGTQVNATIPNTLASVPLVVSSTYTAARAVPLLGYYTTDNNATLQKAGISAYQDGTNGGSILIGASGSFASGLTDVFAFSAASGLWLSGVSHNAIVGSAGFTGGAVPSNHTILNVYDANGSFVVDETYSAATYTLKQGGVTRFNIDNTGAVTVPISISGGAAINAQTGTTYTLVAADNGKVITFSNAGAITLTVPAGLGVGFNCLITQIGAGAVTPTASSTTINQRQALTKTAGQYAIATLAAYAANVFALGGDLQ